MRYKNEIFPFGLSLNELAVLTLTNEGIIERPEYYPFRPKESIILSSKSCYLWGTTIGLLLEKNPDIQETECINAYRYALKQNREKIRSYYSKYTAHKGYSSPFDVPYFSGNVHWDFVKYFKLISSDFILQTQRSAEESYQSLLKKGLIEDPVFTTIFGFSVAVIGFIPYRFTQQTRRGRTLYRKIQALFWSYEMREDKGIKSTNIHFRLWKILRAFKKALAEEMEDVTEKPKSDE